MDPTSVLRTLWRHRLLAIPLAVLAVVAFGYALFLGPRSYQATTSYALITPQVPSELEVAADPALALQTNNPYLRAPDPSLALQVVRTTLTSGSTAELLDAEGLSTDFTVGPGTSSSSQILAIQASSSDADTAMATASRLGQELQAQLRAIQITSGASDRYLISAQQIDAPDSVTEKVSSRLRNAVIVGLGGAVLLFGAVSIAQAREQSKKNRRRTQPTTSVPVVRPPYPRPPTKSVPVPRNGSDPSIEHAPRGR